MLKKLLCVRSAHGFLFFQETARKGGAQGHRGQAARSAAGNEGAAAAGR
ncbi:hypothetical protein SDC9_211586 [bioreactor metagenome]|uniref:Uncharacterized protein n=1 Tax=bioreactor metagenome TaxID=1076179 RepID=A0A645JL30_9ZZZZ